MTRDAGAYPRVATDAIVTGENYKKVYSDLKPRKVEESWVARRRKYWSKKICERHEKYHVKDFKDWSEVAGKKVVVDYMNGKAITRGSENADLITHRHNALVALIVAWKAKFQAGKSYYSMPCEVDAFGDGKEPYKELAKAARKHGRLLRKAAERAED